MANQTQNLAAILSNFDTALEATEVALNSTGSAARENEKYMEGLEAKTNQLKATFQQLASSVVDSGLVKGVLDLANAFLKLLNTPIGTFVTQVTLLTGVLWGGTGLIKAMSVIPAFFSSASTAATGLSAALGITAPQLMLIAAGIAAIIAIAPTAVDIFKQLTDESYKAQSEIDDLNQQLETNKTRLEELNAIPIKNRTSAIQDEIDVLEEENTKLREQLELWEQKKVQADFDKIQNGKTEISGYQIRTGVGDYLDPFESDPNLQGAIVQNADEALQKLVRLGVVSQEVVDEAIQNASGNAIKALEALGYSLQETTQKISSQVYYEDTLEKLSLEVAKFQKTGEVDADFISSYEDYKAILEDLVETATEFEESGGDISGWVENVITGFEQLPDISLDVADGYYTILDTLTQLQGGMEITNTQYEQLESILPGISEALTKTANGYTANADALDSMLASMSNNKEMTEELTGIYSTLISGMGVSESQINKLIAVYPALSSMIRQNAGQYYLEIQALADSASAGNQWARSMITNQTGVTTATIEQVKQRIQALVTEMNAQAKNATSLSMMRYYEQKIYELQAVKAQLENLNKYAGVGNYGQGSGVSISGGGSSGGSTEEDPIAKQTELFKEQIDILEHKLFLMEKEGATEEERIAQLRKIQAELDKQKQWYYSQGLDANSEYIRDLEEQWWDYEDQIKDIYKEQAEIYELLFSTVASKAQEEIDALEAQKQAIEDQNDALEDQIRLEEALDNVARAKQNQVMVYKDGRLQYVTDVDAVSEAQKEVDDINREQALEEELAAIDKEIEKWEEFKEAWESVVDDYQKEQDLLLLEQKLGIKLEGENWEERLGNLQTYVNKYNDLMSKVNAVGAIPTNAKGTLSFQPDNRYASGTSGARSGVSLVGENGPELRVLNRGDGILPADITKNLWAWGSLTPASLMSTFMRGAQGIGQQIGIVIENFNPNLPNVTDGEGFAKYMRNNFWREALQMAKV